MTSRKGYPRLSSSEMRPVAVSNHHRAPTQAIALTISTVRTSLRFSVSPLSISPSGPDRRGPARQPGRLRHQAILVACFLSFCEGLTENRNETSHLSQAEDC